MASNQIVGRTVMVERGLCQALEFRDNALRQDLAELHAPLVEAIDALYDALNENAVLVKSNELAECRR